MGLFRKSANPAALRVETSTGETHADPSEDHLFLLLEDLHPDDHVIVSRGEQTYVQVLRAGDGYLVERREGSEEQHTHARTADVRAAHQDVTTWAFGIDRPFELDWSPGVG